MTGIKGSLLQLVARNQEDHIFINPDITLFKRVYRRHVNFSIEDKLLRFQNKLRFNEGARCRIRNYGDFVHKLYLKVDITSPDIRYSVLTMEYIINLLSQYDITYSVQLSTTVDESILSDVNSLIEAKKTIIQNEYDSAFDEGKDSEILALIEEKETLISDSNVSLIEFNNELNEIIMNYDSDYSEAYSFIKAYKSAVENRNLILYGGDNNITKLIDLKNIINQRLKLKVFPENNNFNNENLELINYLEIDNFYLSSVDRGTSALSHFLKGLQNNYTTEPFETYDSYILLETYLTENNVNLFNQDDVNFIKNLLFNSVYYGMLRNYILFRQMIQIISSIQFTGNGNNDLFLVFYKNYTPVRLSSTFVTENVFTKNNTKYLPLFGSLSIFSATIFNGLNIGLISGETTQSYYKPIETIQNYIQEMHQDNDNLVKTANIKSFMENYFMFAGLQLSDLVTGMNASAYTNNANIQILNLVPLRIKTAISESIQQKLRQIRETGDITKGNINVVHTQCKPTSFFSTLGDALDNDIIGDISTTNISTFLINFNNIVIRDVSRTDEDDYLVFFYLDKVYYFDYKNESYNLMNYLREIYSDRISRFVESYNLARDRGYLTSVSGFYYIEYSSFEGNSSTVGNIEIRTTFGDPSEDIDQIDPTEFFSDSESNFMLIYLQNDTGIYCIWFNNGTSEPSSSIHSELTSSTMVEVEVSNGDNMTDINNKIATAINNLSEFTCTYNNTTKIINITYATEGIITPPYLVHMPLLIDYSLTEGTVLTPQTDVYTFKSGVYYSSVIESFYFVLFAQDGLFWLIIYLSNTDNTLGNTSLIPDSYVSNMHSDNHAYLIKVDIQTTYPASQIATQVKNTVEAYSFIHDFVTYNFTDFYTTTINGSEVSFEATSNGKIGLYSLEDGSERKEAIDDVLNMFFLDIENYSYEDFTNNGLRLYQIDKGQTFGDLINNDNIDNDSFNSVEGSLTVQSSIWNYIYNNLIENYNNLFNNKFFSDNIVEDLFGADIARINSYIKTNYFTDYSLTDDTYDFYKLTLETEADSAYTYAGQQLDAYNLSLAIYEQNKEILNINNLSIPTNQNFDTFENMFSYFTDIIYSSYDENDQDNAIPNTGYSHNPTTIDWNSIKTYLENNNYLGALDYYATFIEVAELFYDVGNSVGSNAPNFSSYHLDDLETTYENEIQPLTSAQRTIKLTNLENIVGSLIITSTYLNSKITILTDSYNGLATDDDLYQYLLDLILNSGIGSLFSSIDENTKQNLYNTFYSTFSTRKSYLENLLDKFNGEGIYTESLYEEIENRYNLQNQSAPFAWVKRLGNAMIDNTYVDLGGQIIEEHNGELIDIISSLSINNGQLRGYKIMIGDVERIQTYDTSSKNISMTIPLYFFFCRRYESSLPIICLNNTFVDIFVKLKDYTDLIYTEDLTYYKKKPKINASILANYIFIDNEERMKICKDRIEMMIDPYNIYSPKYFDGNSIENLEYLRVTTHFKNMTRNIIFTLQNSKYTDGTLPVYEIQNTFNNGLITSQNTLITSKYKNYLLYGTENDGSGNMVESLVIKYNGKDREKLKSSGFYDYVEQYSHHTNILKDGIMNYSLALYPEDLQPSGHGTLTRIHKIDFDFYLKDSEKQNIIDNNQKIKIMFYSHDTTFLRIMSGMGGLAFFS